MIPFTLILLFILNRTASCKNKALLFTESEMISKKLQRLLHYLFSVNLTNILEIIVKYRREIISKHRQIS